MSMVIAKKNEIQPHILVPPLPVFETNTNYSNFSAMIAERACDHEGGQGLEVRMRVCAPMHRPLPSFPPTEGVDGDIRYSINTSGNRMRRVHACNQATGAEGVRRKHQIAAPVW